MPCSVSASGSQTATLATNHTLVTQAGPTGGALYQLSIDTANLAAGETVTLTLQTRTRVADSTRSSYSLSFTGVQAEPVKLSPVVAVIASSETVAILRQDGGTGRAFPWALYRLDG